MGTFYLNLQAGVKRYRVPYLPYLPYPVKTDTYRCLIDALLNNISALLNFI